MTIHVEWGSAAGVASAEIVPPGEFMDAYGTTNDEHVLLMGDDSVFAVEGTLSELRDALTAALATVNRYITDHPLELK